MSLSEQFLSIGFSFIYGVVLSLLYNFNYNLLFNKEKVFKIVFNILFVLDLVLIYFLIIKKINGGIIHPYFYLLIILGFVSCFDVSKKLRKFLKFNKDLPKSVK